MYVGSAQDAHQDQVLDEILVGPVPVGLNKFVLQADPPDAQRLLEHGNNELLGVTVVLVTCSYRDSEFVRVGYYVNNEYVGEYDPEVGPPRRPELPLVQRHILADKPRVTKFPIVWDNNSVVDNDHHDDGVVDDNDHHDDDDGIVEDDRTMLPPMTTAERSAPGSHEKSHPVLLTSTPETAGTNDSILMDLE